MTRATFLLVAAALAAVAALSAPQQAQAQGIGSFVGDLIDGVDPRTFFRPDRCQRRQPKEPRNLDARPRSPTSVRLTWRARDNSCVDYYEITYTAEGQARPRTFSPRRVTDYVVDIDGLEPGTRYVFNVRAVNNANGASTFASTRATTPPQQAQRCNGPPRAPMNVQARSDSPTTLTINWLVDANDRCIERYEVTYLQEGQTVAPRSLAPLYVTDKTVTITGLTPDTQYSVVVAAVSTNGQRSTVTTRGRTQPLCTPLRSPVSLSAGQSGPRSVSARWQNTQKACVRATQVSYQDGNGNRGPIIQLAGNAESYTFGGLQPGQQYTFSVRFVGRDGANGPASTARVFLPNNSQGGTVTVPGRR